LIVQRRSAVGAAGSDVLTLDDALRHRAREHNPAFLRTANDLDVAGARCARRGAAFLPSLNTSLNFSGSRSPRAHGRGLLRRSDPSCRSRVTSQSQLGEPGHQHADDAVRRRLDAAQPAGAARRVRREWTRRSRRRPIQLDAQVSREYYQACVPRATSRWRSAAGVGADRLERTEELLRLAARNRVDVLGARADVAQAEQNVERARGEADKARLTLAATLGMSPRRHQRGHGAAARLRPGRPGR
jgi:outer membrane protein TolC